MPNFMTPSLPSFLANFLAVYVFVAGILMGGAALSTQSQFRLAGERFSYVLRNAPSEKPCCGNPAIWRIDPDQGVSGPAASKVRQGNGPDAVPIPTFQTRPNMSAPDDATSRVRRKRMEIFAFLFLTAIAMPVLAVGTVGSYGLGVWIYQMFAGPPGPPPSPH
jgi:nitrate reductase NapE